MVSGPEQEQTDKFFLMRLVSTYTFQQCTVYHPDFMKKKIFIVKIHSLIGKDLSLLSYYYVYTRIFWF